MKTSRLLSGIGAVAVAMAPVAAQAGTRAADAGVVSVEPIKMTRASAAADAQSEIGSGSGSAVIIAILAAAAVIAGIIVAVDDDDSDGA